MFTFAFNNARCQYQSVGCVLTSVLWVHGECQLTEAKLLFVSLQSMHAKEANTSRWKNLKIFLQNSKSSHKCIYLPEAKSFFLICLPPPHRDSFLHTLRSCLNALQIKHPAGRTWTDLIAPVCRNFHTALKNGNWKTWPLSVERQTGPRLLASRSKGRRQVVENW